MSAPELPVPLSAVALRLADEVGQAVLDRIAAGDLAGAADLDQHIAAVRAELAACRSDQPRVAGLAGQNAAHAGSRQLAPRPHHARPHHARRTQADHGTADSAPARSATATELCPDVPFADNPWQADEPPALRLLLHYACGFIEAAVRADWWPANPVVGYQVEWQAIRLAAVCQLIRHAESTAAMHPDLR